MNRTTGILIAAGLALMSILLLPVSVLLLVDTGDSGRSEEHTSELQSQR